MNPSELERFLGRHSFEKYFVVYEGYLFNHISHGIISLHRMGADQARIQRFVEWYTPRLKDAKDGQDHTQPADIEKKVDEAEGKPAARGCSDDPCMASIAPLRGTCSSFYFILTVFEKQLSGECEGSVEALVRQCYPALIRGLAGSAFHGIIHLGYGCATRNSR